jgi:cytochrome c2
MYPRINGQNCQKAVNLRMLTRKMSDLLDLGGLSVMRLSIIASVLALLIPTAVWAGPLGDAAKKGNVAEMERLLASGADVNEPGGLGTPLHWAAMNGHVDAVKLLVAEGAHLEAQSSMLGTPLHAAARFDRTKAVEALLAAGANPNSRDKDEFTPLMRAIVEKRVAVVETLLSGNSDVDAVGIAPGGQQIGKGPTIALHLAIKYGHSEIAERLREFGAGPTPPEVPADVISNADAQRGRELASLRCGVCHTVAAGDPDPLNTANNGPPLIGLIGRPVADFGGFDYSEALIAYGGEWTAERLYQFALSPMLTVPGTEMNWPPELTPEEVADVTAYFVSVAEE